MEGDLFLLNCGKEIYNISRQPNNNLIITIQHIACMLFQIFVCELIRVNKIKHGEILVLGEVSFLEENRQSSFYNILIAKS